MLGNKEPGIRFLYMDCEKPIFETFLLQKARKSLAFSFSLLNFAIK